MKWLLHPEDMPSDDPSASSSAKPNIPPSLNSSLAPSMLLGSFQDMTLQFQTTALNIDSSFVSPSSNPKNLPFTYPLPDP